MANESSVFISYAADTKPLAEELTRALESQGIDAWVDFKDLRPGQRWKDELERAIGAAQWVLILLGPGNRATAWQEAEWSTALARTWADTEKRLLPVVFGHTEPPAFLRNWVSLRVDPAKEPSTWTRHVLDALRSVRNDAVHSVGVQNRRERQERLDEISKVAEELREGQPDESPIAIPKVRRE
jgi:TIR domain